MAAHDLDVRFGHSVMLRQEGAQSFVCFPLLRRGGDSDFEGSVGKFSGELILRAARDDLDAQGHVPVAHSALCNAGNGVAEGAYLKDDVMVLAGILHFQHYRDCGEEAVGHVGGYVEHHAVDACRVRFTEFGNTAFPAGDAVSYFPPSLAGDEIIQFDGDALGRSALGGVYHLSGDQELFSRTLARKWKFNARLALRRVRRGPPGGHGVPCGRRRLVRRAQIARPP